MKPHRPALRFALTLGVSLFIVELAIMLGLSHLDDWPAWASALLDAGLLTLLIAPLIYWTSFRPLRAALTRSRESEAALQRHQAELEAAVARRTRELDEALRSARSASQAKSEFLASMSHELRTPLNAILGYSQLVAQRAELSEPARKEVLHIQQAGEHLLLLVGGVVDLARVETGGLRLSMETVSVAHAVQQALALARPLAQQHGISLHEESVTDSQLRVHADQSRLVQVVVNYLSNAIKYNRPQGQVRLSVDADEETVVIRVTDTGHGIPPERHHQVFLAPFERFGRELGKTDGVGIGLVIVQRIVLSMGGDVGFESDPGRGSCFWVRLARDHNPMPLQRAAQTGEDNMPEAPARGGHILLAEDNAMNRQVVQAMLDRMGYTHDWVEDGASAVEAARSRRYDLVLMDCQMPRMDGYQAARAIRAAEAAGGASQRIHILAMTANALQGDREACLAAGMDDYVSKPLDMQRLAATLAMWMPARSAAPN